MLTRIILVLIFFFISTNECFSAQPYIIINKKDVTLLSSVYGIYIPECTEENDCLYVLFFQKKLSTAHKKNLKGVEDFTSYINYKSQVGQVPALIISSKLPLGAKDCSSRFTEFMFFPIKRNSFVRESTVDFARLRDPNNWRNDLKLSCSSLGGGGVASVVSKGKRKWKHRKTKEIVGFEWNLQGKTKIYIKKKIKNKYNYDNSY